MRVLIDARYVESQLQGVGRYTLNLLLGLSHVDSNLEFFVFYKNPLPPKVLERSGGVYRHRFQWIKALCHPHNPLQQAELAWTLKIHGIHLFHNTSNSSIWTGTTPNVVTAHELEVLHQFPNLKARKKETQVKRTFRKSNLIITVSQTLADEVESHFHVSRPKIRVISNAIDPWYRDTVKAEEIKVMRDRFKIQQPYFLCVTANRPTKNIQLIEKVLRTWDGNEHWVFTLEPPTSLSLSTVSGERSTIGTNKGVAHYLNKVEDIWLRPLYAAAKAVIVPSLYEGFSLPPLEALACKSLPVVSDIAAHREALKEVLSPEYFFDPSSAESLERALQSVLNGGEPQKTFILEKFKQVVERYSFIETAKQIHLVYKEALGI